MYISWKNQVCLESQLVQLQLDFCKMVKGWRTCPREQKTEYCLGVTLFMPSSSCMHACMCVCEPGAVLMFAMFSGSPGECIAASPGTCTGRWACWFLPRPAWSLMSLNTRLYISEDFSLSFRRDQYTVHTFGHDVVFVDRNITRDRHASARYCQERDNALDDVHFLVRISTCTLLSWGGEKLYLWPNLCL
jgi:hypothetical protein